MPKDPDPIRALIANRSSTSAGNMGMCTIANDMPRVQRGATRLRPRLARATDGDADYGARQNSVSVAAPRSMLLMAMRDQYALAGEIALPSGAPPPFSALTSPRYMSS